MIDEAELLSTRSLEFIRRIHDLASVGVVLAGMPRLLVNLKGKNNELAQLYIASRFACDLKCLERGRFGAISRKCVRYK